jgi:hypothetical protein
MVRDKIKDDDQTFCLYCQKEYASPRNLRIHIEKKHPGSYADERVNLKWATKQRYPDDIH